MKVTIDEGRANQAAAGVDLQRRVRGVDSCRELDDAAVQAGDVHIAPSVR
jgi:hypothetical protein